jgi:Ras-related protein Rab-11A
MNLTGIQIPNVNTVTREKEKEFFTSLGTVANWVKTGGAVFCLMTRRVCRYRAVTSAYYRGALGAMVVYDVTRRATFEHVARWVEELRAHADGSTVVALIGNKADMPAARREVAADEAARLAEEQGLFFSEASALTGDNVERAFLTLLEEVFAVVSRRALELDEARRMRGEQGGGGGGGEVLSLKGTEVDVGSIMETSAMKRSSQCACS